MHKAADVITEYVGHQLLECCQGIAIPLLHNLADVRAIGCAECHFPYVIDVYADLFVCIRQVNLQLILGSGYIIPDLILIRKWSNVLLHVVIALSSVDYSMESPIFLVDTQHGGSLTRCLGYPLLCFHVLGNLLQ